MFGRAQYLLKIIQLCENEIKPLCLVGMDKICKTTIAKATLNYVKDMYDSSCFVKCIESSSDSKVAKFKPWILWTQICKSSWVKYKNINNTTKKRWTKMKCYLINFKEDRYYI